MPGKSKARQLVEADLAASKALKVRAFSIAIAKRVQEFAMLGADNETIAAFIGVDISTFDRWRVENDKMRQALSKGREIGGVDVVRSLVKRAKGYTAKARKVVMVDGQPQVVEYKEEIAGDVTAQRYYLNNRHPKEWQERNGAQQLQAIDLAALVEALHRNRGDGAKLIDGEAETVEDTPPVVPER